MAILLRVWCKCETPCCGNIRDRERLGDYFENLFCVNNADLGENQAFGKLGVFVFRFTCNRTILELFDLFY